VNGPAHQRLDLVISFGNALPIYKIEPPPPILAVLSITYEGFTILAKGDVMYTLPVDHLVSMQVSYVDAAGNPATIDGDVHWETSDESIATIEVDAQDTSIVTVTPAGDLGQVQIRAIADADLGTGVRNLTTVADITVVAGEAVAGTITPVGEAEPIAPHPEPRRK
jgi:hypothetical protein